MIKALPAPLVPADCDLRGMQFMPLDVARLMDSDLFALSTGDEFKAAVALWCKSWNQVPAGSLPNDDRILSHLCAAKNWKKIKNGAMRGWIFCSDNRWYHPVVSEKALEAWDRRVDYRDAEDNKSERQKRWREKCKTLADTLRSKGITPPRGASLQVLRDLLLSCGVNVDVDGNMSTVDDAETSTVDDAEIGKTGTVIGTGTGTVNPKEQNSTPPPLGNTQTSLPPDGGAANSDSENLGATDDKAIAFATGVPALVRLGMAEKGAKSMVGKIIKEAGEEAAVRICGRLSAIEKAPNPAALVMMLIGEEKDPIFLALRERYGECRKLADGRYQVGNRHFTREGNQEVAL